MNTSRPEAVSHTLGQVWLSLSRSARAGGLRDMTKTHPGSTCADLNVAAAGAGVTGESARFCGWRGVLVPLLLTG